MNLNVKEMDVIVWEFVNCIFDVFVKRVKLRKDVSSIRRFGKNKSIINITSIELESPVINKWFHNYLFKFCQENVSTCRSKW